MVVPIGQNAAERDDGCGQWQWSERNRRKHEQQSAETGPRWPVRFRWRRNVLRRLGGRKSTRTRRLHRSQRPGRIFRFLELRFWSFRCLHLARVKKNILPFIFLNVDRVTQVNYNKQSFYKHTCCLLRPNINVRAPILFSPLKIKILRRAQSSVKPWVNSLLDEFLALHADKENTVLFLRYIRCIPQTNRQNCISDAVFREAGAATESQRAAGN